MFMSLQGRDNLYLNLYFSKKANLLIDHLRKAILFHLHLIFKSTHSQPYGFAQL